MLRTALILTLSFILTACGGGGGGSGDSNTPTGATVTISPDTATIDAGQSLAMRVTGGTGPYSFVSSNPQVLPVPSSINNLNSADLVVTAGDTNATETVTITVTDHNGKSAKSAVTVRYATMALSPSALTLASTKTQVFNLVGGRAPFTVTTTRPDLLILDTSGLTGKTFSVFANDVGTQVDDIGVSVSDAAGNVVSAKISIMPLQVLSSILITPSGAISDSTSTSTVSAISAGHQGMVQIRTSDAYPVPRTLTISRLNGDFTLDGADAAGNVVVNVGADHAALATLTVSASAGTQTGKIRVLDNATGKFVESGFQIAGLDLTVAPSTLTAISDTTACKSGTVGVIQIIGGVAPYSILSAAPSVVTTSPATVSQSGGSTTVTAYGICTSTSGVLLTVSDAVGTKTTIPFTNVAVPTAALSMLPSTLTAHIGNNLALTIAGGTSPYTVTSSNNSVVYVTSTSTWVSPSSHGLVYLYAAAVGNANIVVTDAMGLTASTVLTIN